jgi:hypothetical protein
MGRLVLVVDDDALVLELLAYSLSRRTRRLGFRNQGPPA